MAKKKRAKAKGEVLSDVKELAAIEQYENMTPVEIEVPPRQGDIGYKRPKMSKQRFVPEVH